MTRARLEIRQSPTMRIIEPVLALRVELANLHLNLLDARHRQRLDCSLSL